MRTKVKNATDASSDDARLEKNLGFLNWIQEFSKKVVSVTFIIYVVGTIFSLAMLWLEWSVSYEISYIDTFISELNQTFRDVIGGYLIKAATENVIKIGGSYMESYMNTKTTIIEKQTFSAAGISNSVNDDEGEDDPQKPETRDSIRNKEEIVNG